MKKEAKIFLALTILGLFLILSLSFVVAQTPLPPPPVDDDSIFDRIFGITLTGEGIWELAVTKFLLMILIFTIVYGITDIFIIHTKTGATAMKILASIVIAYLSVIYLAPAEIFAALAGWGAMAITITAIIPFAVIIGLSWRLASNPDPGKILIQKLLLGIFAVYLTYRVGALIWFRDTIPNAWAFALPIYITALVIIVLMLIFSRTMQRFILSSKVSGYLQISDALDKQEALANVVILREKASALEKINATVEAASIRRAANALEKVAKAKFT